VRVQFELEENILISLYALEVLETFAEDFGFGSFRPDPASRHQGNLFMADAQSEPDARTGIDRQRRLGADVDWLSADEIADRWAHLASVGLTGGTFCQADGSVDPNAVLQGYRRTALESGVRYIEAEVDNLLERNGVASGVRLIDGSVITAPIVVNAAGAWATRLCETVGVEIPVVPVMRTVHRVDAALEDVADLPSFFLPSGLYVLPEADRSFLIGWSLPDDPVGFDFTFSRHRFDSVLWPELVSKFPAFDRLQVRGGWAGLYAQNTFDHNAILGEWPLMRGLYLATGFSGHGFQQCHAVGRYLAELITDRTPALDLARLGPQRIISRRPLRESGARII